MHELLADRVAVGLKRTRAADAEWSGQYLYPLDRPGRPGSPGPGLRAQRRPC